MTGSINPHVLSMVKNVEPPFPRQFCKKTQFDEDKDDEDKCTLWKSLMKENNVVYPFIANPKRSLSSQYLNTHSKCITRTLGYNSNVQIGSPRCMVYVVHYSTNSTQKEDKGSDFERVGNQVIRHIHTVDISDEGRHCSVSIYCQSQKITGFSVS